MKETIDNYHITAAAVSASSVEQLHELFGSLTFTYQSMFSLSLILGLVLGGLLFESVSPQAVFAVSAGLMVLTFILSIGMQRIPLAGLAQNEQRELESIHH
jgi:MFS family permease